MRSYLTYVATVLLLNVTLGAFLLAFNPFSQGRNLASPLPYFLTRLDNEEVTTTALFGPMIDSVVASTVPKPNVQAKAALIYDLASEKTLFTKNARERLPIASLTKIVTAIVALEHEPEEDSYLVFKEDLVGENSMGLSEGEVLALEDLLYGLMLPSGNDAAETIASNFPGGREHFIEAMNSKVASLGLVDTNVTNPSGLEGDGKQFSTAYDLLVITRYALSHFPLFREVIATFEHTIPYSSKHKAFFLQNETNLLTSYPGVKGVKTGYTDEAGLCLVTYLEYKGHRIIGILLGSNNRRGEMKDLLDYSLKTLGVTPPKHS